MFNKKGMPKTAFTGKKLPAPTAISTDKNVEDQITDAFDKVRTKAANFQKEIDDKKEELGKAVSSARKRTR